MLLGRGAARHAFLFAFTSVFFRLVGKCSSSTKRTKSGLFAIRSVGVSLSARKYRRAGVIVGLSPDNVRAFYDPVLRHAPSSLALTPTPGERMV